MKHKIENSRLSQSYGTLVKLKDLIDQIIFI